MKRFLLGDFSNESQRGANVFDSEVVFPLDFFERHATRQAANNHRYWHTRATNYWLAVRDRRIDNDAILSGHDGGNSTASTRLVEPQERISLTTGTPRAPRPGWESPAT